MKRFKEDKILTILSIIDLKIKDLEERIKITDNEHIINEYITRRLELLWLLDDIKKVLKDDYI